MAGTWYANFLANPTTTFQSNDIFYLARSPYVSTVDDFGFTYSSLIPLNTKGDLFAWSNSATKLAVGATNGMMLQVNSAASTGLSWSTATYPSTTTINQLLVSTSNNVVGGVSTVNSAVLATSAAGVPTWLGALTNGQIVVGSTGAIPVAATITAGTNISVTNGPGTITIANTGSSGPTVNNVTTTTVSIVANNSYVINASGFCTLTLPATAAIGDTYYIRGYSSTGWRVAQNSGQTIHSIGGSTTTGTGGSISFGNRYDCITIMCVTANTDFILTAIQGTPGIA